MPSPDKYEKKDDWVKKNFKLQFSKLPRITFSDLAIKDSARTPGPGAYDTKHK